MKSPRVIVPLILVMLAALLWAPHAVSAPPPAPTFTNAMVHDPDHIHVDGTHYFFGSHLQVAASDDLMNFTQVAEGVHPANPLFDDVTSELAEALDWAETDTLWAPDVIQLDDGRFYMYYNACRGDSPRSAMGIAVADDVTGPYTDLGIILKSGMWGEASEDGTIYDARIHPNVVDPDVFFDEDGRLWMVYGSFSGGIFILELDPTTGFPFVDQGYGKHLWGGNHARIEGAAVHYDAAQGNYYMFVTYGGLDATGGYNIRVARSENPDGPYVDASGLDMADVKADPSLPLFDDASIAESAVKLAGNHQFVQHGGVPGSGSGAGYVSPGGSTAFTDPATGQLMLGFHTRFPGRGETHQLRVHQLIMDVDGWPVLAPFRYGGGTLTIPDEAEWHGTYSVVDHGPREISTEIRISREATLHDDGTVTGEVTGTWRSTGEGTARLVLDDEAYEVIFSTQWHPDAQAWVPTFSGLSGQGVAVWGAQTGPMAPVEPVDPVVGSYAFDGDLSGTNGLADATVSGPTIDAAGGELNFVEGVRGSAVHLDSHTGVRLPDGLLSGPTWSVALWLKPETTTEFTTAFFAARDADNWVSLLPQGHGGVDGATMVWSGTQWFDAGTGSRIPLHEWSHLAFSIDSGSLTVWLNGERVVERDGFPDVLTTRNGIFSLGVNWWDAPYHGAIDELELRTSVFTDEQVAALVNLEDETDPDEGADPDPEDGATSPGPEEDEPEPTASPSRTPAKPGLPETGR